MMSLKYKLIPLLLLITSCKSKTNIQHQQPPSKIVSIAYLKSLYVGFNHEITEQICIEGILKSNDSEGNFYKTLVLEDQTGGVDVKIDLNNIFVHYYRGRKYTITCNGLTIVSYGGTIQLGFRSAMPEYEIDAIPQDKITTYFSQISDQEYSLVPTMLKFNQLSDRYISCWVGFDEVQFIEEELGLPWTDQDKDTDRHLINKQGDTLHIRTSINAHYAEHMLPLGSGHIEGILGRFNTQYQLRLATQYYVILDKPRFSPAIKTALFKHSPVATHPTTDPSTP